MSGLEKGADRSSHRTYPTRQSGQVTNCSGTLGQWTPLARVASEPRGNGASADRKSTRLNSSHSQISYAVFCLKKKKVYEIALKLLVYLYPECPSDKRMRRITDLGDVFSLFY